MTALTVAGVTEILIDHGLPDELLPEREGRSRVAILTQPGATDLAIEVSRRLISPGYKYEVIGLPDREEAKTLEVAASVYDALARFGLARFDTIVAVGGGSVTDLAGYVAGTWLRGVEVVHVPTTLLGAVDASIGGKTGVNVGGKNLVGVFWHPTRVLIDIAQLERLPHFLVREGMAEAYKAGLIGDPDLADLIGAHGMQAPLGQVVERAVRVKAAIVDADTHEHGVRAYLNFGHTIGHAIEYASALSHGESVGLGMVAASAVSAKLVGFSSTDEVVATVNELGLPVKVQGLELARVLDLLGRDKKRDSEGLRMVLLEAVGQPTLMHVDEAGVGLGLAAIGL
ncbi:MAG TPA: 3-dehydroquinate synthase family protein [Acidimicrobiia bacterium]|nr:3-dehydroquinate synthase family protein [Acidimicrobiia bacterium]